MSVIPAIKRNYKHLNFFLKLYDNIEKYYDLKGGAR